MLRGLLEVWGDESEILPTAFRGIVAALTMIIGLLNLVFKKWYQTLAVCCLWCIFLLKPWDGCCTVVYDSLSGSRLQDVVAVVAKWSLFHLHPEPVFAWFSLSLLTFHVSVFHNIDEIQELTSQVLMTGFSTLPSTEKH